MKSTGIVRKIDELGRIVLPMELRRVLGISNGDPLEIFTDDNKIVLRKYEPADIFSGDTEDLIEYMGKRISRHSILELCTRAGIKVAE